MSSRLHTLLHNNPSLGFVSSFFGIGAGAWAWFTTHASEIMNVLGVISLIVGILAGWYTIRAQKAIIAKETRENL